MNLQAFPYVSAHGLEGVIRAGRERPQQRLVRGADRDVPGVAAQEVGEHGQAASAHPEVVEVLEQRRVAGRLDDGAVHRDVRLEGAARVDVGADDRLDGLADMVDGGLAQLGHAAGGKALDRLARLVHVPDVTGGDRAHDIAALARRFHQVLPLQAQQRIPDRGAADAKLAGQLIHDQPLARRDLPGEQRLTQPLIRDVCQRVRDPLDRSQRGTHDHHLRMRMLRSYARSRTSHTTREHHD